MFLSSIKDLTQFAALKTASAISSFSCVIGTGMHIYHTNSKYQHIYIPLGLLLPVNRGLMRFVNIFSGYLIHQLLKLMTLLRKSVAVGKERISCMLCPNTCTQNRKIIF